jgi:hypothetical protein
MAQRHAEGAEREAAAKRPKPKLMPKPKVEQPSVEQLRRDAEEARVNVERVKAQYGERSQHVEDAKQAFAQAQEAMYAGEAAATEAMVRGAAEGVIRKNVEQKVRA